MERRKFIKASGMIVAGSTMDRTMLKNIAVNQARSPRIISTWNFGAIANNLAWPMLLSGARGLDAIEAGARAVESDLSVRTVGYGAYPDRDGHVTLDACIMDEHGNAGSVTFLEGIEHPVSVARMVMEKTPHVMLSGEGAYQFARENGFPKKDLLTPEIKAKWEEWKVKHHYTPTANIENHDTIGILCLDENNNLSGCCTTSGLAYKMHGRVGDSPIIGAALFVDNEYGAAVCTGLGELVMRNLTSFLVVEQMRQGATPQKACEIAIDRVISRSKIDKDTQVGVIAMDKKGNYGAYSVLNGFNYFLTDWVHHRLIDAKSRLIVKS